MSSHADRQAANFRLETQEKADTSKPFPRRRVVLANGLILHTRWYVPPKIDRSELRLNADVHLPNGIVLRASTYKLPAYGGAWSKLSPQDVKAMDAKYLAWKAARDKTSLTPAPKQLKGAIRRSRSLQESP